jgi:predicted transcriptional regulator
LPRPSRLPALVDLFEIESLVFSIAFAAASPYDNSMAKSKKFDLEAPPPIVEEEDEETLAAIDEGIRDAEAGRVVSAEKARELLPKWTTASSTRKER